MEINNFLEHREEDTPNITLIKRLYLALGKAAREDDIVPASNILVESPTWKGL